MADDDAEDCLLVRDALQQTGHAVELRFVRDGDELFDYLSRQGEYAGARAAPRPDLILLDLKMPRMDGGAVLRRLKSHNRFRRIPVIALTTSTARSDIGFSYDAGVNSYLTKPVTFRALVDMMDRLVGYWLDLVELPPWE